MFQRTLFDSSHETFRQSARRFVEAEIAPYHDQWERDGQVSREAWQKAGEAGFLCAALPEAYGGAGADFVYSAIILEELCRANAMGPGFTLHSDIVAPYILHYGTEEQRRRRLPDMAAGRKIGAIAMTEPSGGSDVQSIKTHAVRDGDEWVLSGQKVFITNGLLCDLVIVACKTDPSQAARGMSLLVVEAGMEGFRKGRKLEKIGWKAQDTAELFFDEVRVPVANMIGAEGRGFVQLMEQLPQERLIQAIRCCATMEAALEWTLAYVTDRKAFGRNLSDFQNTRFKLAEARAEVQMMRVFTDHCIDMHMRHELDSTDAAMAKMLASEMQSRVLDALLQMFGGYGYMWEYPIARAWADSRMARIAGGTGEIMREIIGRSMTGRK